MRTRDEIYDQLRMNQNTRIQQNPTKPDMSVEVLYALLEVLCDCRELLSEHAIAHHLLKPELKAEIAEMIVQAVKEADGHA